MNEGLRHPFELEHDEEFENLVVKCKIDLLTRLVSANVAPAIDNTNNSHIGVTYMELLALTPHEEHDAMNSAIYSLQNSGLIQEVGYTPFDNTGVFLGYELAHDIPAAITSGRAEQPLNDLYARISKNGIGSLNAEEWALKSILEAAMSSREIDLAAVHHYVLEHLHDEGVEKWHIAFAGAVSMAEKLFRPQSES